MTESENKLVRKSQLLETCKQITAHHFQALSAGVNVDKEGLSPVVIAWVSLDDALSKST